MARLEQTGYKGGITRHQWGSQEAVPYTAYEVEAWVSNVRYKQALDQAAEAAALPVLEARRGVLTIEYIATLLGHAVEYYDLGALAQLENYTSSCISEDQEDPANEPYRNYYEVIHTLEYVLKTDLEADNGQGS